jgi:MFS family permease
VDGPPPTGGGNLSGMGRRHLYGIAMFCGALVLYAQRAGMAVGIVRMQSLFGWGKQTQGLILSGFYVGYMALQVPAGYLASRFGGSRMLCASVLATSLLALLAPVAARSSAWALFGLRLLQGVAQAPYFSASYALCASWSPPAERTRLGSAAQLGGYCGTVISTMLSGWQCDRPDVPLVGGWEGIFYLHAVLGCIWSVVWLIYMNEDSPATSRRCSDEERRFIQQALAAEASAVSSGCAADGMALIPANPDGDEEIGADDEACTTSESARVESTVERLEGRALVCAMLGSAPMLAMCAAHMAADWGSYILQDGLPPYLRDVWGFSLSMSGMLAALPTMLQIIVGVFAAQLADWLCADTSADHGRPHKQRMRTVTVRKLLTATGMVPGATLLAALGLGVITTREAVITSLVFVTGVTGCNMAGYQVNALDIAPRFAAFTHAIMNTGGQLTGWLAPITIGWMTSYPEVAGKSWSREQWEAAAAADTGLRGASTVELANVTLLVAGEWPPAEWLTAVRAQWAAVFLLASAVYLAGVAVFTRWGSGVRQPWDVMGRLSSAKQYM